jgi:hypothetical protein
VNPAAGSPSGPPASRRCALPAPANPLCVTAALFVMILLPPLSQARFYPILILSMWSMTIKGGALVWHHGAAATDPFFQLDDAHVGDGESEPHSRKLIENQPSVKALQHDAFLARDSAWRVHWICCGPLRDRQERRHGWHVQSGTSLPELMELGGWKSYERVLRYAHLAPGKLSCRRRT